MMTGIIYRLWGKEIKARLAVDAFRPKDFTGLTFAFTDTEGCEYYTWPDVSVMPLVRVKEVEAQMMIADAGRGDSILKEVTERIIEKANAAIAAKGGKERNDALASIAVLAREILFRKEKVIPEEAYYALAAVCSVRKDEDPGTLDRVVHAQKIEEFRKAGRAGHPFFQASASFKQLLGLSLTTEAAFSALVSNWIAEAARIRMVMQATQ